MPTAEDFDQGLQQLFAEAERAGKTTVVVEAGDLHRRVGGYPGANHRMPVCCAAMRKARGSGDHVLAEPPSGQGASLLIEYALPRSR
jgi:hypothetical protein